MLDLYEELKSILTAFDEAHVSYALCGGLALAVYGKPRATVDIDMLILPGQLETACSVLAKQGYNIAALPMKFAQGVIAIHRVAKVDPGAGDLLSVDLLLVTPPLVSIWESRRSFEWEGLPLTVVSPQGLIALKRLRSSGQDMDDIAALQGLCES